MCFDVTVSQLAMTPDILRYVLLLFVGKNDSRDYKFRYTASTKSAVVAACFSLNWKGRNQNGVGKLLYKQGLNRYRVINMSVRSNLTIILLFLLLNYIPR